MRLRAIDTKVLARYLTNDDPKQSRLARELLDELPSPDDLFLITIPVICELSWLLRRPRYGLNREQIANAWDHLLGSGRFRFQARAELMRALEQFRQGPADLSDYLILHLSRQVGASEVLTFDRDFASSEQVSLLE